MFRDHPIHIYKDYFQIRLHAEVLDGCEFEGDIIHPSTAFYLIKRKASEVRLPYEW